MEKRRERHRRRNRPSTKPAIPRCYGKRQKPSNRLRGSRVCRSLQTHQGDVVLLLPSLSCKASELREEKLDQRSSPSNALSPHQARKPREAEHLTLNLTLRVVGLYQTGSLLLVPALPGTLLQLQPEREAPRLHRLPYDIYEISA